MKGSNSAWPARMITNRCRAPSPRRVGSAAGRVKHVMDIVGPPAAWFHECEESHAFPQFSNEGVALGH